MKHYINLSIIFLLISCMLFSAGCSSIKSNEEQELPSSHTSSISITDEQTYFLQQYIAIIPPFQDIKKVENDFWHNFIYNLYTHSTANDGLIITDENKNNWIVIEKDSISAVTKQLFGIELPEYFPHEENLYRNGTAFYILLTPEKEDNILSSYKFVRNLNGEITFRDTETSCYYYYTVSKNDSELGFIIKSLSTTGSSPAAKNEETTRRTLDITEEYTFDIEEIVSVHN